MIPDTAVTPPDPDYTVADQERMTAAHRYFAWQRRLIEPHLGRRVLEIGCGVGNFTELLVDRDLVVGVDIDAGCVTAHAERFAEADNVMSWQADVLAVPTAELASFGFDSVVLMNVLEHIEHDVDALRHLRGAVPQGGTVIVLVPAFMSLYGPIDRRLGHHRRYTRSSLAERAKLAGLGCESMRYVNAVGFLGWWVNARVRPRDEQSARQIAWFDRWVVPLQSRAESIVSPPVGQSLLAVLRRP